jgi:hypothetical protein
MRALVGVVAAHVRRSRFRRRILGGGVTLVILAVLLAVVDAAGSGLLWGDGVADTRNGVGVGGESYRGGGTIAEAALRGLNYPVRLAGRRGSTGGGGVWGGGGGGATHEFAALAAFREGLNGPSERSEPAWWERMAHGGSTFMAGPILLDSRL